jgi:endoglucanase
MPKNNQLESLFIVFLAFGLIFIFLFCLILSSLTLQPINSLPHSIKPLHVTGNQIRTSDGASLILRGVDYSYFIDGPFGSWMLPNGQIEWNTWNTEAIKSNLDAVKSWGCNIIRVPITVQWWVHNSNGFKVNLQYFISEAANRGLYVDLVFWRNIDGEDQVSLPYPPYDNSSIINSANDFVNVWSNVASTLKSYPNVIFELWNEPNGDLTAETSWHKTSQQCVTAIRETGAKNLILLQWNYNICVDFENQTTACFVSGSMDWISSNPLTDPTNNIVYSAHLYSTGFYDSTHNYELKNSYSDMLWALNYAGLLSTASQHPVLIGEIGCNLWVDNTNNEFAWFNNTLTILNQYGISYCGWAWAPWRTGMPWGLVNGEENYAPNQAGQILQRQIACADRMLKLSG